MTEIEAYIRTAAIARGIDPDVAVRIARTEGGLTNPVQQSNITGPNGREPSFGPFQLNMAGGLGNQALRMGIDPRDPAQWKRGVDFALDVAAQKRSWGDWHGARDNGIPNDAGFGAATKPIGVTLTSLRHVGGAGSDDPNFTTDTKTAPVTGDASTPATTDDPSKPETWLDKLKKLVEGDDAKSVVNSLSGKGDDSSSSSSSSSGLYKGDQNLTSSLPSLEAGDIARMQSAQALMAQLMASKRRQPLGLTLSGAPNAV